jgi:hypothetical protein
MSDSESKPEADAPAFVEDDAKETRMPYDSGKVPIIIAIGWVVFLATYVGVMASIALPDLRKWMAH